MNTLPLIALLCAAGMPIDVTVAPDQPVPYVFSDEPLIVEVTAREAVSGELFVEVSGMETPSQTYAAGPLDLSPGGVRWTAISDLPAERGRFVARILLETEKGRHVQERVFSRIGRPRPGAPPPLGAHLETFTHSQLWALSGIPVRTVRLDGAASGVESKIEAAREAGLSVVVGFNGAEGDAAALERAAFLGREFGAHVSRWEIGPEVEPATFTAIAEALRQSGARGGVALVAASEEGVESFLRNHGNGVAGVVIAQDAPHRRVIGAFRAAIERAGYEGMPLHVLGTGLPNPEEDGYSGPRGPRLVRQLILNTAAGAAGVHLYMPTIFEDGVFQEGYVHLSAMAQWLQQMVYVGELDYPHPVYAQVFRPAPEGDLRGRLEPGPESGGELGTTADWLVVVWSAEASQDLAVPTGGAEILALTDGRNNAQSAPSLENGAVQIRIGTEPRYLLGRGGDVLRLAARQTARSEAQAFVDSEAFQDEFPSEFMDLVESIAQGGHPGRLEFFSLLRMFPHLEEQWRGGGLSRSVAIPAMASLQRIVRSVCILEEERGEAFLEPLEDMLETASEYQSRYLTGSGGAADGRGNWLVNEVGRLSTNARRLAAQGRPIEAAAVAALAEYRGRALEHTLLEPPDEDEEDGNGAAAAE